MDEPADFDFDLDRSTEQAWAQFTDRLAEVVSVIDDNGSLTIGTPSLRDEMVPYVRFVQIDPDDLATMRESCCRPPATPIWAPRPS